MATTNKPTLSDATAGSLATLFVGVSNTKWLGLSLPWDVTSIGAAGCSLLSSGEIMLQSRVGSTGGVGYSIDLPDDTGLIGITVFHQFVVFDSGANALGVALSGAARVKIGF